jgi:hypothetical protein
VKSPSYYFSIYDVWYEVDTLSCDGDGDGFPQTIYLEWDADTDQESATVRMVVYGLDSEGNTYLIFEDGWCVISEAEFDTCWYPATVPYQDSWDFRFVLMDNLGDSVAWLEYGRVPHPLAVGLDCCRG